jgi:putative hydrolase of the HAD superfamily
MKNPRRITTLFLDIGGVLLTNGWDHEARARAAERFGLDLEELTRRHEKTFDAYELGMMTLEEYLSRVVFTKRRSFSRRVFRRFVFAQSKAHPRMIGLFRRLKKSHGVKIIALNNEGRELMLHRIRTFRLDTLFDFYVTSCFVHLHKPDRAMYQAALDLSQVSPRNALYIDDRLNLVQAARALGMHAIHHEEYHSTKAGLAKYGLKIGD